MRKKTIDKNKKAKAKLESVGKNLSKEYQHLRCCLFHILDSLRNVTLKFTPGCDTKFSFQFLGLLEFCCQDLLDNICIEFNKISLWVCQANCTNLPHSLYFIFHL